MTLIFKASTSARKSVCELNGPRWLTSIKQAEKPIIFSSFQGWCITNPSNPFGNFYAKKKWNMFQYWALNSLYAFQPQGRSSRWRLCNASGERQWQVGGCQGDVGGFWCLQNLSFSILHLPCHHSAVLESLIPSSYTGGRKYHWMLNKILEKNVSMNTKQELQ